MDRFQIGLQLVKKTQRSYQSKLILRKIVFVSVDRAGNPLDPPEN